MTRPPKKKAQKTGTDPLANIREMDRTLREARRPAAGATVPGRGTEPDPQRRYDDLLEVAVSLASTLELRDILDRIVDGIIRVTRCERGFLMLREPDGSFSTYTGRTRDNLEWDERSAREISGTVVGKVVDSHKPFIETDLASETGSLHAKQILAAICLPLTYKEELIGVIYADSGFVVPAFEEADRAVLRAFGAQASLAVENARRHGDIKVRRDQLEEQNLMLHRQLAGQFSMYGMISKNRRMLDVFATVEKIAPLDISVLIEGESGTGKELLARAIHERSSRREGPFEALNCASIPAGLVESTLFGHRKGAFTNSDYDKPGVFELADGGTLLLDEIGEMPLDIQPKLLRVLQEREVKRVGEDNRVRKVNVRIIAATNIDLKRAVDQGRFRPDLFFRFNAARVTLPPLRERREDIAPLAQHFLSELAAEKKQPVPQLSGDAGALLLSAHWSGNVRELKNAMEWGFAFQDDKHVIHAKDLERFLRNGDPAPREDEPLAGALDVQVDRFEESLIRRVLEENQNNVTVTAKALDISRQQLHLKIKKYKIITRQ